MADKHIDEPLDYLYEELPPEGMAEVRSHLADCPQCRADMRSIRETVKTYRQAARPAPPSGLARRTAVRALKEAREQSPSVDADAIVSRSLSAALPDTATGSNDAKTRDEATQAMIEKEFARLKQEVMGEMRVGGWRSWLFHPGWAIAAGVLFVFSILIVHSPRMAGRSYLPGVQSDTVQEFQAIRERKIVPSVSAKKEAAEPSEPVPEQDAVRAQTPEEAPSTAESAIRHDEPSFADREGDARHRYTMPPMVASDFVPPATPATEDSAQPPSAAPSQETEIIVEAMEAAMPPVEDEEMLQGAAALGAPPSPEKDEVPFASTPAPAPMQSQAIRDQSRDDAHDDGYAPLFPDALPPPSPDVEAKQKATMGAVQPDVLPEASMSSPSPVAVQPTTDSLSTADEDSGPATRDAVVDAARDIVMPDLQQPPPPAPPILEPPIGRERTPAAVAPPPALSIPPPASVSATPPAAPASAALRPPAGMSGRDSVFAPAVRPQARAKSEAKALDPFSGGASAAAAPYDSYAAPVDGYYAPSMPSYSSGYSSTPDAGVGMWEQVIPETGQSEAGPTDNSLPDVIIEWQGPMEPPQIVERPTPVNVPERIQTLAALIGMAIASGDIPEAWEAVNLLRQYDKEAADKWAEILTNMEKDAASAGAQSEQPAQRSADIVPELPASPVETTPSPQPQAYMEFVEPPEDPPMSLVRVPAHLAPPGYAVSEEPASSAAQPPAPTTAPVTERRERRRPRTAIPAQENAAPVEAAVPEPAEVPDETEENNDRDEDASLFRQKTTTFSGPSSLWDSTVGREVRPLGKSPRRGSGREQETRRPFSTDPYVRGD